MCYGVEAENVPFYSQMSLMPLKSDGSLCIMEALSRSQLERLFFLELSLILVAKNIDRLSWSQTKQDERPTHSDRGIED